LLKRNSSLSSHPSEKSRSGRSNDKNGPVVIPRSLHSVSRRSISPAALKVLYRLKDAGYQAFLVGGAVRDLLLGRQPKDFDVVTNAHPEQVKELFRSCRLIGRRFHLAHVRVGPEIIEVATFRASHTVADEDNSVDEDDRRVLDNHGRILRDNLYGSIDEDIWRRDFTANALYYNIDDYSIWDYTNGVADAEKRVLKLIGDPETRYREDPVRMLRAIRFAAKLEFTIDAATAKPISELAYMVDSVPAARLFDEVTKLFLAGSGLPGFKLLRQYGLLGHLFADLDEHVERDESSLKLVELGLHNTDARVKEDKSVTPAFLFAVLLWPAVRVHSLKNSRSQESGTLDFGAIQTSFDTICARVVRRVAVPKRFSMTSREVLALQSRFDYRGGRRSLRLLDHPRFRAAYDFLLLRAAAGEVSQEVADWWTELQTLPAEAQVEKVESTSAPKSDAPSAKKRRRRRVRRKPIVE
jgi:poly(A) polymerase